MNLRPEEISSVIKEQISRYAAKLDVSDLHRETGSDVAGTTRSYTVTIKTQHRMPHTQIIEQVSSLPGVLYCEEL